MTTGQKQWAMHQGMEFAHQYAQRLGLNPNQIPTLVCIRNPYDHVLSGYKYLADRPAGTVPDLEPDFSTYVQRMHQKLTPKQKVTLEQAPFGLNSKYIMVGRKQPANVTIAKTEDLQTGISAFIRDRLGIEPDRSIAKYNASSADHRAKYYGPEEEEIVYRLHRKMFDNGIYQRYEGLSL